MRAPSGEQALIDRVNLDARIAFVAATFLLAYGFSALLDRVGAPERFVGAAPPYFTIFGLATLGFLLHSMRVSVYYAAGRALPAAYAGFGNAAIVIALMLPFAARLAGRSWGIGVIAGLFIGLAAAAFYLGPLLRKTGSFTLSGLLAARFPSPLTRLPLIAAVALSSALLAIAGVGIAVDALVDFTGAGRLFASFVIGAASLIIAGPGGLAGVIWCAAGAAGVALLGLGWPLTALGLHGVLPSGLFIAGSGWREAAALLADWRVTPSAMNFAGEFGATLSVALGVATLAPVLAPAVTTYDVAGARRAGYAAVLWTFVLSLLMAATVSAASLTLAGAVRGQPAERLPEPIYEASGRRLVSICGVYAPGPSEAQRACGHLGVEPGAPLQPHHVRPVDGDYLLGALPAAAELGAAASGLLASAVAALGLALAAAGLQACATAVGHDALYRLRGESDLTSRRLALSRLTLVAVSAVAYAVSARGATSPGALIVLALALSAACVAPSLALAFWPRAGDREACFAVVGGVLGLGLALIIEGPARRIEAHALAALAGAVIGLAAGAASALASKEDKPQARAFVMRMLRGDAQMVEPDKGA